MKIMLNNKHTPHINFLNDDNKILMQMYIYENGIITNNRDYTRQKEDNILIAETYGDILIENQKNQKWDLYRIFKSIY